MSHECPIMGCTTSIGDHKLMCRAHWALVPADKQQAVYAAWRRGDVVNRAEHATACHAAIKAVKQMVCTCPPEERMHSGWMHRETPEGPICEPPIKITRCRACWKAHRADGKPYDEDAQIRIWAAWRAANPDADHRC